MKKNVLEIFKISISAILFIISFFFEESKTIYLILVISSYVIVGYQVLYNAILNIFKGKIFDENFLMALATIGAFATNQYHEAIAVMLFYQIGELFQNYALEKSRKSIASLMDIRPDYANLKKDNYCVIVNPNELKIDDLIVVKPGEKIPVDCIIVSGNSLIDCSKLTGESLPKEVFIGDTLLSGSINLIGLLTCKVDKIYKESTVNKILELVENASSKKSKSEKFITKFSLYYTPIVVIIAFAFALIPPIFLGFDKFNLWLSKALVFLVISCPCALVISIPLGFFGGIGAASKNGILIKGSNYLENLSKVDQFIFDKTGTLTKGTFTVQKIVANSMSNESLLQIAASCERFSNHPIAKSICAANKKSIFDLKEIKEIVGMGIEGIFLDHSIYIGNRKLMNNLGINIDSLDNEIGTVVYVSKKENEKLSLLGYIVINDELKDDAKETIDYLKNNNNNVIMFTGDNEIIANSIASKLGINYYANLLPNDKYEKLEQVINNKSSNSKVAFIGDGINDCLVLSRADVGIAMGGVGSEAAIEAADVVIMTDELQKIEEAIEISKRTIKIVKQNIVFALGVKFLVLILGAFGVATMWEAVFADVGVSIIAILNSLRVLNTKNNKLKRS